MRAETEHSHSKFFFFQFLSHSDVLMLRKERLVLLKRACLILHGGRYSARRKELPTRLPGNR